MNTVETELAGEIVTSDRQRIAGHVRELQIAARENALGVWNVDPAIALGFEAQVEVLQTVLDFIEALP
jgi:hypothetical protein